MERREEMILLTVNQNQMFKNFKKSFKMLQK